MRGGGAGGFCLRIIAVSHPWLSTNHADPEGHMLRSLARVLHVFIKDRHYGAGGTYGVVIPFCSLYQPAATAPLTMEQASLHEMALDGICDVFAHPHTVTFILPTLPEDVYDGMTARYYLRSTERGWAFLECAAAS